jgi:uncharacterized protein (DUF58 family)
VITQRAWLVGIIGFCFYLIAIVNTLPSFYLALTWLSMGVLGSSLAIALLSLIGLRCAWRAPSKVVSQTLDDNSSTEASAELAAPHVEIQLANAGTLNKTGILIEVLVRRETKNDVEKKPKGQPLTRRFLMEALPSASSLTTAVPLAHLPRGRYRVEELRLIGSDVLGLFRIQKRVPPGEVLEGESFPATSANAADNEILIGPATVHWGEALPTPRVSTRGDGGVAAPRFLGQGDEMRGTRLYAPGDDLRHVHWKSTARKGELVVKEFHHTLQTRVLIVWDGDASTHIAASKPDTAKPDAALIEGTLSLAASLCRAFENSRQPGTLLKLDAQPLWIGSRENSAARGSAPNAGISDAPLAMEQVARALATATMNRESSLPTAISDLGCGWPAASEVFLVTASTAVDLVHCVAQWRANGANVAVALVGNAATAGHETYQAQVLRLREADARVVEVSFPNTREGRDGDMALATTLRRALHELLQRRSSERATADITSTRAPERAVEWAQ